MLRIGCCVAFMLCLFMSPMAWAQQVEMASSANPVGSGARAMGMGGAFIGVADDATAASWNPAGLVQLERPELSTVLEYYSRRESYESADRPETEGSNTMGSGDLNYLSAAYPFSAYGRNMVFSINYQHLYDMTKSVGVDYTWNLSGGALEDSIGYEQEGGLYAVSPAYAVMLAPNLYVGATLNIWENPFGDNCWSEDYEGGPEGMVGSLPIRMSVRTHDEFCLSGYNANVGFLWRVSERYTLGGVYKGGFEADITRAWAFDEAIEYPTLPPGYSTSSHDAGENDMRLDMPRSYGLGLGIRLSDSLSLAADVYRTEWGDYVMMDSGGNETSPVTGMPREESDVGPTHQVRLGAEYLMIRPGRIIALRGGVLYDPEPSEGSPEDYFGVSIGGGIAYGSLVVDAAYQYRWGDSVEGDVIGVPGTSADVRQHLMLFSGIYHF